MSDTSHCYSLSACSSCQTGPVKDRKKTKPLQTLMLFTRINHILEILLDAQMIHATCWMAELPLASF